MLVFQAQPSRSVEEHNAQRQGQLATCGFFHDIEPGVVYVVRATVLKLDEFEWGEKSSSVLPLRFRPSI